MIKKLISVAVCLLAMIIGINAQAQELGSLPLNPQVRHGVLPNGLSYYILHNEKPQGRANFYIAQKVGSTLETQSQLGLAHFLEHMAFNGTSHYPGKNMLNYLQSKGIRFGQDINAYTSFDETVYNINNVPTSDKALMDSVLLVLHDWSGEISLEGEEIDAERKVIQEEWRMRNNAGTRFFTALLPQIYKEYQYQQMPIGTMDVVMNFPYKDLRDYYHKWYRPDQQGIIIVGDFDAAEMEQKVKDLFSTIKMPENPAPRVYPTVSDNNEPIYFAFADPEAPNINVRVSFKKQETPFEQRNTQAWLINEMVNQLITAMIDNRLTEYGREAECEYAFAGVGFQDFYVSKTKDAFDVVAIAKTNPEAAMRDALEIVARAAKTGFTESEYTRAKDEMLAQYEKLYNERDKTETETRAQELIRFFLDNNAAPGIEIEYQLLQAITSQVPVSLINESMKDLLTSNNQCIVVFMPEKEGVALPSRENMVKMVETAIGKEYEPYKDEVITEPLIPQLPAKGSITKTKPLAQYDAKEYTLSNGVKVILKSTDFSSDEILMTAVAKGGKETWSPEQAADMNMIDAAIEASKLGNFDNNMLAKYLAGKNVSLNFSVGAQTNRFVGKTVKKDINTLMELVYANFVLLQPDPKQYANDVKKYTPVIEMQANQPTTAFRDSMMYTLYNGDPRFMPLNAKMLTGANYDNMFAAAKKIFSNASDFTFVFVGNIDEATIMPLLEQYIATLPATGKASPKAPIYPIQFRQGKYTMSFKKEMNTPSTLYNNVISGPSKCNAQEEINVDIAGNILSNIFTETIREKLGAAYSPYAYGTTSYPTHNWMIVSSIQTNAEQQAQAIEAANAELARILREGVSEDQFNKVKGAAVNQYEISLRKNSFWRNTLVDYILGIDNYVGYKEKLDGLTLKSFNQWLKKLYNGKNDLNVIMEGVPEPAK